MGVNFNHDVCVHLCGVQKTHVIMGSFEIQVALSPCITITGYSYRRASEIQWLVKSYICRVKLFDFSIALSLWCTFILRKKNFAIICTLNPIPVRITYSRFFFTLLLFIHCILQIVELNEARDFCHLNRKKKIIQTQQQQQHSATLNILRWNCSRNKSLLKMAVALFPSSPPPLKTYGTPTISSKPAT